MIFHGTWFPPTTSRKCPYHSTTPPTSKTGCSVAEISAGIVCSCMPILRALLSDGVSKKKSPFASLKAFFLSRSPWSSFRRPAASSADQSHSFNQLCPNSIQVHKNEKKSEPDDEIRLKTEIGGRLEYQERENDHSQNSIEDSSCGTEFREDGIGDEYLAPGKL